MHGKLDADDVRDVVRVRARVVGGECRYFLVVDSSRAGRSRIRLRAPSVDSGQLAQAAAPFALVRIDGVEGREVAVRLYSGAAVSGFRFYTLRSGRIRSMGAVVADGDPLAFSGLFAEGGSLGSGSFATDCAYRVSPRTVVFSSARQMRSGQWRVVRRWYQGQGHDFYRTTKPTQRASVGPRRLSQRFPEFAGDGVLHSCDGRRAWD